MKKLILYLALVILCSLSISAMAGPTYSFTHIQEENDGPEQILNGAIGEAQFFMTVDDQGFNSNPGVDAYQVLFRFDNLKVNGWEENFIRGIYFYDGVLLEIAEITDSSGGVSFTEDAADAVNPDHLPGDNAFKISYGVAVNDAADADSPGSNKDGIDPGEWLSILYTLQQGAMFSDVITGLNDHTIAVGLKAQGFPYGGDEDSESFVNNGVIPAPGAIVLGGIGIGLVGWLRRRRML